MGNTIQFIWDPSLLSICERVKEDDMSSIEQFRSSIGLEIDKQTGTRVYFIPKYQH